MIGYDAGWGDVLAACAVGWLIGGALVQLHHFKRGRR